MKSILFSLWIAIACLAVPVHAASITGYLSEANYNAAVGADVVYLNFNGLAEVGSTGVFTGVDFNTLGAANPDLVNLFGYVGDTGNPATPNNVGQLQGVLDVPAFALAMNILSAAGPGEIRLFDDSDNFVGGVGYLGNGFVGVVTDMAFSSFELSTFTLLGGGPDRVFIDDFRVSALPSVAEVPLPAAWLLFLGGFGLFAGVRAKNKQK